MVRESHRKYPKPRARGVVDRKRSDATERRQAEKKAQLLREELALFSQVATFRELTGWLAHELNQPLTAILGNAQAALRLMEREVPDLKELREIFEDIVAEDQRATEMIRRVRSKIRRGATEKKPLLLNDLIKEIMPAVQNNSLAKNISVNLDLDSSLPPIAGNRVQLLQLILNLVVNAFEAMRAPERPGKLVLRTRHSDREVVLDVVDSGRGIPSETLRSIFDPLVTSKAEALGMGLRLSWSIAVSHNGRLWAENNIDGGAAFHLALPAEHSLAPSRPADIDRDSPSNPGGRSHGLTILIADDGKAFRSAVSSILSEFPGLKLLAEAVDGAEAVKKAAELNPDLVLIDIGLPIIDGVEAAAKMRIVAPNAKLLFLTQHDSPEFVEAALRAGALGYVLKVDVGSELLQAAKAVVRGEQYLSSGIRR